MGLTTQLPRLGAASIAVLDAVRLQEACMLLSHLLGNLEHGPVAGYYVVSYV